MQARANRGILYIDEVNLLDDGLVDVVLDSAASGRNAVEREGISINHPAKFIMIGSGNAQASLLARPSGSAVCCVRAACHHVQGRMCIHTCCSHLPVRTVQLALVCVMHRGVWCKVEIAC